MHKVISTYFIIIILISGTISPVFSNAYAAESDIFPSWVRTVFKFWANEEISDEDLKGALEFLLANKVLDLTKKQTKSAPTSTPIIKPAISNFQNSQKSNITVSDENFFSVAQNAVTGWIKEIKNNPTADLLAKSALPIIPVVGPLLANLYDNAEGTTEQKNNMVLEQLELFQKMNADQLTIAFAKLDGNREAIEKNTYKLDDLLADSKEILSIVKETNKVVKEIDKTTLDNSKKLDVLMNLINNQRIGKNTETVSIEIKESASQITQTFGDASNLGISQMEVLAKSYVLQGLDNSARIVYNKILETDPTNHSALLDKGWIEYDKGRYEDSLDTFTQLVKYHPGDSEGWEGIGWNLIELKENNFEEALDAFEKAYNLDASNVWSVAGIGWAHLLSGQCEQADNAFQWVLDADPDNLDAIEGLNEMWQYGC